MSFVQLDIDAYTKAYVMADSAGIGHAQAIGGLARCWEWCWRRKSFNVNETLIGGFFNATDRAKAIIQGMVAVGFLDQWANGQLTVRDDQDRLGIRKHAKRAAGAAKARAKKQQKQTTAKTEPSGLMINTDEALSFAKSDADSGQNQAAINVDGRHQEPESHKAILDHNLLGGAVGAPFPAAAESEFQAGEAQAAAVLSGRTGDHAAREDDMPSAGDLARKDRVVAGLFKALSQPATPEAPAAPPLDEHAPPNTSPAPRPAAPAINEMRPSAETPEQPAQQTPTSPGEEDEFVWQMDDIHQRVRGRPYQWKDIDRDILDELRIEGFTAQQILEWWEGALGDKGRRIRYLRELKALMLKELRPEPPKARPGRVDPDDGILRGTL